MKTGFIDWLDENLNLYIFEKKGQEYDLSDTASFPAESGITDDILSTIVKNGIDELYLSLPLSHLTLRELAFPFSEEEKISDTVAYELEGILLENINDYIIDHVLMESTDDSSRVLAVCLEKTKLQEIISIFSAAGIEPRVITSIDLWLYGAKGENILGRPITDRSIRAETAKQELANPSINLRQHELAYRGDIDRIRKNFRLSCALALVLLIIISAISGVKLSAAKSEQTILRDNIRISYSRIFPEDKKIVDPLRQFNGKLNLLKSRKAALGGIPVLDLLRDISILNTGNITLTEFIADREKLLIRGTAASFDDVDSLKNSLGSSYKNVKVLDSNATTDRKVSFSITMQEKKA